MSMQTLGGRMVAVDMNAVAPGSQMQIGMSPDAAANLGLNKQKFDYQQGLDTKNFNYQQGQDALSNARSEFDLVNTPAGSFTFQNQGLHRQAPLLHIHPKMQPLLQPLLLNKLQRLLDRGMIFYAQLRAWPSPCWGQTAKQYLRSARQRLFLRQPNSLLTCANPLEHIKKRSERAIL